MTTDELIAIGFEHHGDGLRAPGGTGVAVTPLNGRCLRFKIELPSGSVLSFVVAQVALKKEEGVKC
jgi:hypothetical protein